MTDETVYVKNPRLRIGQTVIVNGEEYMVVEDLRKGSTRKERRAAARLQRKLKR